MSTFTFCFSIYFNLKICIYLLYNCLSKLATHTVSEGKLKKKEHRLLAIVARYKVDRMTRARQLIVFSGAEQCFGKNPTKFSFRLN